MKYEEVKTEQEAIAYITHSLLVSLAKTATLKRRSKSDFRDQIGTAQNCVNWMEKFKINPHNTVVYEIIKEYKGNVQAWITPKEKEEPVEVTNIFKTEEPL